MAEAAESMQHPARIIDLDTLRISREIAAGVELVVAELVAKELRRKQDFMEEHRLMDVEECAAMLRSNPEHIQELARRYTAGDATAIPCKKIGQRWRFHPPTVVEWILRRPEVLK